MITPLSRYTSAPTIAEALTTLPSGVSLEGLAGTQITLLTNVPCAHARTIEIFLNTPVKLNHIIVRSYAGERSLSVDTKVTGAIAAGTTTSVVFPGPYGQTFDILVELNALTGGGNFAKCWVAAKS